MRQTPTLLVLASMFLTAATLKGIGGAAAALDVTSDDTQTQIDCLPDTTPAALSQALQDREQAVSAREAALTEQQSRIDRSKEQLEAQLIMLQEAEAEMRSSLAIAERGAQDDLERLTRMYEAMDPEQAGRLFTQMDPAFAAEFLARMSSPAAAGVLASLEPDHAYAMSVYIAGRNVGGEPGPRD